MNSSSTLASHIFQADIVLELSFVYHVGRYPQHSHSSPSFRITILFSSTFSLHFYPITFDTKMLMHFVIFLQHLKEDVAQLDLQIDEFLNSSDSLLDDSDLPEEEHLTVERESELLEKRWNKVKSDANSREPRFVNAIKLHLSERATGEGLSTVLFCKT